MIVPIVPGLHRQLVMAGAPVAAVAVPAGQLRQVALDVCAVAGLYVPDGQSARKEHNADEHKKGVGKGLGERSRHDVHT